MKREMNQIHSGQPESYKTNRIYKGVCCDCGLEHLELYDVKNNEVIVTVFRDDWCTKENRRQLTKRERRTIVEALGGTIK